MLCVAVGGCCREEGVSKDFLGTDEKDHGKGVVHPDRGKAHVEVSLWLSYCSLGTQNHQCDRAIMRA